MVTPDFFETARVTPAKKGRFIAIGTIGPRTYAVIFAPLGTEAVSIISLRRASLKERKTR